MATTMETAAALEMGTPQQQQALVNCDDKGEKTSQGVLGELPADFLALILCHLSPREVARAACVSRSFRAASTFDSVWENVALSHLPNKYRELLALEPAAQLASKREVFEYLCSNRVFFANHTQGFWLERGTGALCLGIASRAMYIEHGDDYRYWGWLPDHQNSLFPEVARLKEVCWFEAKGEAECCLPAGTYTLSWRLLLNKLRNWRSKPVKFSMSKNHGAVTERQCFIDPRSHEADDEEDDDAGMCKPTIRAVENGWREYDVGAFDVEPGDAACVLKFSMTALEEGQPWKSGLCLDGVVVRPSVCVSKLQPESRESLIRFLEMNDQQPVYRQPVYNHRFRR